MLRCRSVLTIAMSVVACVGWFTDLARGDDDLWMTDFAAASAKAKAENKVVMAFFTGSDWCGYCKELNAAVFETNAFQSKVPQYFVLVKLDYPRRFKLSDELTAQNAKLADRYAIGGFPSILVLDPAGQKIQEFGSYNDKFSPEKHVEAYINVATAFKEITALKLKLKPLKGLERATALDKIVAAYETMGVQNDDFNSMTSEIIALDPDNKAGLKSKNSIRRYRIQIAEAKQLKSENKFVEAAAACEQLRASPGITADQLLEICFEIEGECRVKLKDFAGIIDCLKKTRAVAPKNPKSEEISKLIKWYTPAVEAQKTLQKLQSKLEKTEGAERAKLLDKLVDAQLAIDKVIPDEPPSSDLAKYREEIIELDGNNKLGLKAKHTRAMNAAGARN